MIDLYRLTTRAVRYQPKKIENERQSEAASRVNEVVDQLKLIGGAMARIDETDADQNRGTENNIYGSTQFQENGKSKYVKGSCELNSDGSVRSLSVELGADRVKAEFSDKSEGKIHYQKGVTKGGLLNLLSTRSVVSDEYIVLDGNRICYKDVQR